MSNVRLALGFLVASVLMLAAVRARADDWPQWRGPNRDGHSQETGLLKEWPKDGPRLLWQVKDAGYGYATPSVVGDRLYLLGDKMKDEKTIDMDDEFVQAR